VTPGRSQRGVVTLVGALFILVTISVLLFMLQRMSTTQLLDTGLQNDSVEALFLAESGIERASFHYANGTACAALAGVNDNTSRGSFSVLSAGLLGNGDCRLRVEGRVSSTVAANAAVRTVDADLRLSDGEGWAVGDNGTILRWDGSAWNSVASGTTENLNGVHCVSSNDCWAVGDNGTILRWDGSAWNNVASGTTYDLFSVACEPNNPNNCFASGGSIFAWFFFTWYRGVIQSWDGAGWSNSVDSGWNFSDWRFFDLACPSAVCYVTTANGVIGIYLGGWFDDNSNTSIPQNGIDCSSDDDCWSVGDRSGNNRFSFDRRDAGGWTPSTLDSNRAEDLRAVSCADINNCKAVGDRRGGRFTIVSWNGAGWTVESFNHSQRENLNGVHCIAANDCWAVGDYRNGATGNSLHWDGVSWTYIGTPVTEDLNDVFFLGAGAGSNAVTLVRWQEVISN